MAFDGLMTVMENNRLARRLTGTDLAPLHFPLLPADSEEIVKLAAEHKNDSYETMLASPIAKYSFLSFLKYDAEPQHSHYKLRLLDEIDDYKHHEAESRATLGGNLIYHYFEQPIIRSLTQHNRPSVINTRPMRSHTPLLPMINEDHKESEDVEDTGPRPRIDDVPDEIVPRLLPEDTTAPEDLFDEVYAYLDHELRERYFPKFTQSKHFINYIQHAEYCQQSNIGHSDFTRFRVVGRGAYGIVNAVSKNDTQAVYAMKEMNIKQIVGEETVHHAVNERNILAEIGGNPFVTDLKYAFQHKDSIFFLMDYASGGDLRWNIRHRGVQTKENGYRHFPEDETQFYCAEVLLALEHLHGLGIVYRDLKPHNILLSKDGHVLLSDYGLAEKLSNHPNNQCSTLGGTPCYWPPEALIRKPYGVEFDIWSFGVLVFFLLTGFKPKCTCKKGQWCTFLHDDEKVQEDLAMSDGFASYNIHFKIPDFLSDNARDLITQCLDLRQRDRITLAKIKQHPFFADTNWPLLAQRLVPPPYVPPMADISADSIESVGELETHRWRNITLDKRTLQTFRDLYFYDPRIVEREVAEALLRQYKRFGPLPEVAYKKEQEIEAQQAAPAGCCVVM